MSTRENREVIDNLKQINEAIELAIKIQNAGIATVFVWVAGHINNVEINLHFPIWISGQHAHKTISITGRTWEDCSEANEKAIDELKSILEKGPDSNEIETILNKQREVRLQQYQELKKEFETQPIETA